MDSLYSNLADIFAAGPHAFAVAMALLAPFQIGDDWTTVYLTTAAIVFLGLVAATQLGAVEPGVAKRHFWFMAFAFTAAYPVEMSPGDHLAASGLDPQIETQSHSYDLDDNVYTSTLLGMLSTRAWHGIMWYTVGQYAETASNPMLAMDVIYHLEVESSEASSMFDQDGFVRRNVADYVNQCYGQVYTLGPTDIMDHNFSREDALPEITSEDRRALGFDGSSLLGITHIVKNGGAFQGSTASAVSQAFTDQSVGNPNRSWARADDVLDRLTSIESAQIRALEHIDNRALYGVKDARYRIPTSDYYEAMLSDHLNGSDQGMVSSGLQARHDSFDSRNNPSWIIGTAHGNGLSSMEPSFMHHRQVTGDQNFGSVQSRDFYPETCADMFLIANLTMHNLFMAYANLDTEMGSNRTSRMMEGGLGSQLGFTTMASSYSRLYRENVSTLDVDAGDGAISRMWSVAGDLRSGDFDSLQETGGNWATIIITGIKTLLLTLALQGLPIALGAGVLTMAFLVTFFPVLALLQPFVATSLLGYALKVSAVIMVWVVGMIMLLAAAGLLALPVVDQFANLDYMFNRSPDLGGVSLNGSDGGSNPTRMSMDLIMASIAVVMAMGIIGLYQVSKAIIFGMPTAASQPISSRDVATAALAMRFANPGKAVKGLAGAGKAAVGKLKGPGSSKPAPKSPAPDGGGSVGKGTQFYAGNSPAAPGMSTSPALGAAGPYSPGPGGGSVGVDPRAGGPSSQGSNLVPKKGKKS